MTPAEARTHGVAAGLSGTSRVPWHSIGRELRESDDCLASFNSWLAGYDEGSASAQETRLQETRLQRAVVEAHARLAAHRTRYGHDPEATAAAIPLAAVTAVEPVALDLYGVRDVMVDPRRVLVLVGDDVNIGHIVDLVEVTHDG